jgi:kynurenine formamidase
MTDPAEGQVIAYLETLSNWGRWGDDDERGTLNFITPEKRLSALALPEAGQVISCTRRLSTVSSDDNPHPLLRFMIRSGEGASETGRSSASDWVGMRFHGRTVTHLDSLSHYFWQRRAYNGRPSDIVRTESGAAHASVEVARDGIVSRGVLLDVPRVRGIDYLQPSDRVTVADLEACERAAGLTVSEGDVLLIRTGRDRRPGSQKLSGPQAGLRADCLPWLRERRIAVLVGDGVHDVQPPVYERIASPIHTVGIVALGLWLLDNAELEELAASCVSRQRWEFLFVTSPLALESATGSPLNPLAIV